MQSPTVEVVTFTTSEAYRKDPRATLQRFVDFLTTIDGFTQLYHGPIIEDQTKAYMFVMWESYEHHQAMMDGPLAPDGLEALKPALGNGPLEMCHTKFQGDPVSALEAPVTELNFTTPTTGKTVTEVIQVLDQILSPMSSQVPNTWGLSRERDDMLVAVVGWDSVEAHQAAVQAIPEDMKPLVSKFTDIASIKVGHCALNKGTKVVE